MPAGKESSAPQGKEAVMRRSTKSERRTRSKLGAIAIALTGALACMSQPALAAAPAAGWTIESVAEPMNFAYSHNAACQSEPTGVTPSQAPCDSYVVVVRNTGSVASGEPVVISDSLPAGMEGIYAEWVEQQPGSGARPSSPCALSSTQAVRCEYTEPIAPGGELILTVNLKATTSAAMSIANVASVEGGGLTHPLSTDARTAEPNTLNGVDGVEVPFAASGFVFRTAGFDGLPEVLAGAHPYAVTASFQLPSFTSDKRMSYMKRATQEVKNIVVNLPPGLIGDPQATPRCALDELTQGGVCPAASRVGRITFEIEGTREASETDPFTSAIFNITPEVGYPAEFGFEFVGHPVLMYAKTTATAAGYGLSVSIPGLIGVGLQGVAVTFFGDPALEDGGQVPTSAFLTNPVNCAAPGPLTARVEVDTWGEPRRWSSEESAVYPHVSGCGALQFQPTLKVQPEDTQADSPSGYGVDLEIPQAPSVPSVRATPELKKAVVALAEGVSVSPAAADGLVGCQETGPEGIEIPRGSAHADEAGPGEAIGVDGLAQLTPGHCPSASALGTAEVVTPLLPSPLQGHVYLAAPRCGGSGQPACTTASAANGELFGLYLEAEGSGVVIKLRGSVAADPTTGRLTATFDQNPQLPFSDLRLQFHGGPRAPLANPQTCGTFTTSSDLEPWSAPETPDASTLSSFVVDGCSATRPFAPSFTAGTTNVLAGGFTPFTLTFSRQDGEQDLAGLTLTTPPGLLGLLKTVQRCPEPQASQGSCDAGSLIGHVQVAAGPGSHPYWVQGNVYLTGPYGGAPYGLSIVTPAKAGPFNLGNIIVRAAIHIDPHTAQITVVSDPLPQTIDGIPLRVQTVNVTIDRPGFMFNPTGCTQRSIDGTITSAQGTASSVSSPFAAAGCKTLPFHPAFTVSTQAKTSRKGGASLDVKVAYPTGPQANIRSVAVTLPKQLPARLTTIQQACLQATFAANPASCPAASAIGTASAYTPVLARPLTGPAYLVSHGGAAFPDLVVVLQGEGITLDLVGSIDIKKGVTSSTFASVPDAPVSSFELKLPEGPHSGLAAVLPAKAKGSMCGQSLTMPTTLTGQNGAQLKQSTKIAIAGCPKAKKKPKAKQHKKSRKKN
jgi:hypothetical protein